MSRPVRRHLEHCPFCAGHEEDTPAALALYPPPSARPIEADAPHEPSPWQVRVVPNKYPAVTLLAPVSRAADPLSDYQPGHGTHEVIIESPQHTSSFSELTDEQAFWSFVAYRDRLSYLAGCDGLEYGLLFKNCRSAAGATLEHSHSQLLATALIPTAVQQELRASEAYARSHQECIFCAMYQRELAHGERIVATTPGFVAFCPFASRFPYEVWVLPRNHEQQFQRANLNQLQELSGFFQRLLRALEKIIPQAPYNYWLHTLPFDTIRRDYYHWHIELIPRITTQAGFEWGSGCYVNAVSPEDAASELRAACD